jgi:quercetin dioxygenase-like cupin family protein
MTRVLLLALPLLLAGSAAHSQMNPPQMKWGAAPPGLPAGAQLAVLSGDPAKTGMFTIRLRFPAGYRVMPHHHPTDELVTVISGQTSIGMGDSVSRGKMKSMVQGGYVAMPAKMNHYAFTRTGATIQITSNGPFEITYVNPKDDPRKK